MRLISLLSIFAIFFISGCVQKKEGFSRSSHKSGQSSGYVENKNVPILPETINNTPNMHRATMRPYQVFGKWYEPTVERVGEEFSGIASWYGPDFHAKKTSNGEVYNMYAMTAAHKTLPMNTMVNVLNLDNGKSTVVRINDRGPFVDGRIIDLSNSAAEEIGMIGKGTANVKLTVLGFNAKVATTKEEKEQTASAAKFLIQVGAFRKLEGAKITQSKLNNIFGKDYPVIIKEGELDGQAINRLFVSGFRSQKEAEDFKIQYELGRVITVAE